MSTARCFRPCMREEYHCRLKFYRCGAGFSGGGAVYCINECFMHQGVKKIRFERLLNYSVYQSIIILSSYGCTTRGIYFFLL